MTFPDPNIGTCRCCNTRSVIGRWGMCTDCNDATERFIATRRQQLLARAAS